MPYPSGSVLNTNTQVTVNVNGVDYKVWDEGRKENWAYDWKQQKATWTWRCLWADRLPLLVSLIGGSEVVSGTTLYFGGWGYPTNPNWLCQNVEVEGDGLPTAGAQGYDYQRAKLTLTFKIPEYTFGSPKQIGEQELDFSFQDIPLSTQAQHFKFTGTGKAVDRTAIPNIRIGMCNFRQSVYNRASLPIPTILALVGKANQGTFFGGAAEFTIFNGAHTRRKITQSGALNWDIDYSFTYNTRGWNNTPDVNGNFLPFTWNNGDKLFKTGDFNQLFV